MFSLWLGASAIRGDEGPDHTVRGSPWNVPVVFADWHAPFPKLNTWHGTL